MTTADYNAEVAEVSPATPATHVDARPMPTRAELAGTVKGGADAALVATPVVGTTLGLILNGAPLPVQLGVSAAAVIGTWGLSKLPLGVRRRLRAGEDYCAVCDRPLGVLEDAFRAAHPAPVCGQCAAQGITVTDVQATEEVPF